MTETELDIYWENKKEYYTRPDVLVSLEDKINRLCEVTELSIEWGAKVILMFELLCFTLDTPQGRKLYLKLLNHAAPFYPKISERYWAVYDNQENMKRRYQFPKE